MNVLSVDDWTDLEDDADRTPGEVPVPRSDWHDAADLMHGENVAVTAS